MSVVTAIINGITRIIAPVAAAFAMRYILGLGNWRDDLTLMRRLVNMWLATPVPLADANIPLLHHYRHMYQSGMMWNTELDKDVTNVSERDTTGDD